MQIISSRLYKLKTQRMAGIWVLQDRIGDSVEIEDTYAKMLTTYDYKWC